MPSSAGRRNARLRFQRRASVSDGAGNTLGDWADLCGPLWAQLTVLKGRETVLQQRLAGVALYEITVLSSTATRAITNADRAVNDRTGETYNLTDVGNPDQRNIEIVMLAQSGGADG